LLGFLKKDVEDHVIRIALPLSCDQMRELARQGVLKPIKREELSGDQMLGHLSGIGRACPDGEVVSPARQDAHLLLRRQRQEGRLDFVCCHGYLF
jgi:hypothetical protein